MELSERKKQILRAVVENYIQTAEPVGSKAIVVSAGLKVSSATIRNEMAELETLGYLEQPHTSAGRIPSPKGYRLYVNELMEEHRLTMQEAQKINEALNLKIREMDQVMTEAGKIISQLTKYPTFSLTKGTRKATIARYDLLMVEESAFIAVLMTDGQMVKNKLFRLPTPLSETQLQLLGTLLNTSFTGLTLEELGPELRGGLPCRGRGLRTDQSGGLLRHGGAGGAGDQCDSHRWHPHAAGPPGVPEPGAGGTPDELSLRDGRGGQPAGGAGRKRKNSHWPGERGRRVERIQRDHGQL